jgi:hypothetical protein
MEAKIGTLARPQRGQTTRLPWVIAIAEALIIVALAITVFAVQLGRTGGLTPGQSSRAVSLSHGDAVKAIGASSIAYGITGTGPGLARAGVSTVPSITGTGPGLVQVAEDSGAESGAN